MRAVYISTPVNYMVTYSTLHYVIHIKLHYTYSIVCVTCAYNNRYPSELRTCYPTPHYITHKYMHCVKICSCFRYPECPQSEQRDQQSTTTTNSFSTVGNSLISGNKMATLGQMEDDLLATLGQMEDDLATENKPE